MTMTFAFPGSDVPAYRTQTNRQASCAGVTMPSFRCGGRRQVKTTAGRKMRVPGHRRAGFVCRDCAGAAA